MTSEEIILWAISLIQGLLISDLLTDLILIKYPNGKFKFRFGGRTLNPFISHNLALILHIVQFPLTLLIAWLMQSYLDSFTLKNLTYWITIACFSTASAIWIAIKRLQLNKKKVKSFWIAMVILYFIGVVIILKHNPQIIEAIGNFTKAL